MKESFLKWIYFFPGSKTNIDYWYYEPTEVELKI